MAEGHMTYQPKFSNQTIKLLGKEVYYTNIMLTELVI